MATQALTPQKIIAIRNAFDVTQERFAQVLGVTWTTVSRWETGASRPTGLPHRLLHLLERAQSDSHIRKEITDQARWDPLYIVYCLLQLSYEDWTRG